MKQSSINHILTHARMTCFSPAIHEQYIRGLGIAERIPVAIRERLQAGITGKLRVGFSSDYDATLVPTNEVERRFYVLGKPRVKGEEFIDTLSPFGALALLGTPTSVISGNTTEYVESRCTNPMVDFILASPVKERIGLLANYALNGGYGTFFDQNGAYARAEMDKYNGRQRLDDEVEAALAKAMGEEVAVAERLTKPLIIRSGETDSMVFSPIVERRARVQVCVVGVFEGREGLIDRISGKIGSPVIDALSINPGGQHSIDGQKTTLHKQFAGMDLAARFGLQHIFYLGDAVYRKETPKGPKIGNDLAMADNPNTDVFAVNETAEPALEIAKLKPNVHWIGPGASTTRDFLTWYAVERANHLCRTSRKNSNQFKDAWEILKYIRFVTERSVN